MDTIDLTRLNELLNNGATSKQVAQELGRLVKTHSSMSNVANKLGRFRSSMYKTLDGSQGPSFQTILEVCHALNFRLFFESAGTTSPPTALAAPYGGDFQLKHTDPNPTINVDLSKDPNFYIRERVAKCLKVLPVSTEEIKKYMEIDELHMFPMDSLDYVELIMEIEDEFSIEIPDEICEDFTRVSQIVNYIKSVDFS